MVNGTSPIAERHQISEAVLDMVKIKAYKRPHAAERRRTDAILW